MCCINNMRAPSRFSCFACFPCRTVLTAVVRFILLKGECMPLVLFVSLVALCRGLSPVSPDLFRSNAYVRSSVSCFPCRTVSTPVASVTRFILLKGSLCPLVLLVSLVALCRRLLRVSPDLFRSNACVRPLLVFLVSLVALCRQLSRDLFCLKGSVCPLVLLVSLVALCRRLLRVSPDLFRSNACVRPLLVFLVSLVALCRRLSQDLFCLKGSVCPLFFCFPCHAVSRTVASVARFISLKCVCTLLGFLFPLSHCVDACRECRQIYFAQMRMYAPRFSCFPCRTASTAVASVARFISLKCVCTPLVFLVSFIALCRRLSRVSLDLFCSHAYVRPSFFLFPLWHCVTAATRFISLKCVCTPPRFSCFLCRTVSTAVASVANMLVLQI